MIQDLSFWQWFGIFVILFGTSLIQGAIGFASALIAVPLVLSVGAELPQVLVMMAVVAGFQSLGGWWGLREHINYSETYFPIVMRLLCVPIGVFFLSLLDQQFDKSEMKMFIGIVVLGIVAVLLLARIKPQESIPRWATGTAFGVSGVMQGMVGMAGPPTVLWVMALNWDAKKTRAFLLFTLLASIPVQMLSLYWKYPDVFYSSLIAGAIVILPVLLGVSLGVKLGGFFSKPKLKAVSYTILIVSALWSIASPFVVGDKPKSDPASNNVEKLKE